MKFKLGFQLMYSSAPSLRREVDDGRGFIIYYISIYIINYSSAPSLRREVDDGRGVRLDHEVAPHGEFKHVERVGACPSVSSKV